MPSDPPGGTSPEPPEPEGPEESERSRPPDSGDAWVSGRSPGDEAAGSRSGGRGGYPLLFKGGPPPEGLKDRILDHFATLFDILAEFLPGARRRSPTPRPDPARQDASQAEPPAAPARSPAASPDPRPAPSSESEPRQPPEPESRPRSRPDPPPRPGTSSRSGSTPEVLFPSGDAAPGRRPSSAWLRDDPAPPPSLERATLQLLPGRLEPLSEAFSGRQVRFLKGPGKEQEVTIGKRAGEPPSHVTLDHPSLREEHARMLHRDGRWFVTSSSEDAPVRVNGREVPVGDPHPLEDGDRVHFGELELLFRWP